LIINGPTSANWDIDLGTVTIQDWFHTPIFTVWFAERSDPPVSADTGLINGKNKNGSLGEYSEFEFIPGKKYRMRLINTSTDQHFKFSIDQHDMTVQAADFVPIEPYTQTVLEIALGILIFCPYLTKVNDTILSSRRIKTLVTIGCGQFRP
jgi:FtsP/CotA-like multicopper oxidase with cupredoxin domain